MVLFEIVFTALTSAMFLCPTLHQHCHCGQWGAVIWRCTVQCARKQIRVKRVEPGHKAGGCFGHSHSIYSAVRSVRQQWPNLTERERERDKDPNWGQRPPEWDDVNVWMKRTKSEQGGDKAACTNLKNQKLKSENGGKGERQRFTLASVATICGI